MFPPRTANPSLVFSPPSTFAPSSPSSHTSSSHSTITPPLHLSPNSSPPPTNTPSPPRTPNLPTHIHPSSNAPKLSLSVPFFLLGYAAPASIYTPSHAATQPLKAVYTLLKHHNPTLSFAVQDPYDGSLTGTGNEDGDENAWIVSRAPDAKFTKTEENLWRVVVERASVEGVGDQVFSAPIQISKSGIVLEGDGLETFFRELEDVCRTLGQFKEGPSIKVATLVNERCRVSVGFEGEWEKGLGAKVVMALVGWERELLGVEDVGGVLGFWGLGRWVEGRRVGEQRVVRKGSEREEKEKGVEEEEEEEEEGNNEIEEKKETKNKEEDEGEAETEEKKSKMGTNKRVRKQGGKTGKGKDKNRDQLSMRKEEEIWSWRDAVMSIEKERQSGVAVSKLEDLKGELASNKVHEDAWTLIDQIINEGPESIEKLLLDMNDFERRGQSLRVSFGLEWVDDPEENVEDEEDATLCITRISFPSQPSTLNFTSLAAYLELIIHFVDHCIWTSYRTLRSQIQGFRFSVRDLDLPPTESFFKLLTMLRTRGETATFFETYFEKRMLPREKQTTNNPDIDAKSVFEPLLSHVLDQDTTARAYMPTFLKRYEDAGGFLVTPLSKLYELMWEDYRRRRVEGLRNEWHGLEGVEMGDEGGLDWDLVRNRDRAEEEDGAEKVDAEKDIAEKDDVKKDAAEE
ncbi:hypothetical protein P154DRAFT_576072 [Amniculicola lignicola CBS 123094]|uniref:Uncharacterized protein n=1 Tax=Amniculicola lignicola CBS 123094 TaxID=1392246 RepID=A0A6A5WHG1_9PLEO|nr:hypothetical protein P154DRAFT_576072 [Amniculicola lignicola CBS 123094]